jgi:hypothetical protein
MDHFARPSIESTGAKHGPRLAADPSLGERLTGSAEELAKGVNQCAGATVGETELARLEARAWKIRAEENARARDQVVHRIRAARRDVYDANLRAEEADFRAEQATATAREAEFRAEQAEVRAEQAKAAAGEAGARAERAEARALSAETEAAQAQIERDRAVRDRDAVLFSTAWRATWPIRAVGHCLPWVLRRALRTGAQLGWWCMTLKLPRKLSERRGPKQPGHPRSLLPRD